jgi:hypothetical protein
MNEKHKHPKRRYHMTLELGADDMEELIRAIDDFSLQLSLYRKELAEDYVSVSGGPHSGYSVRIDFDSEMTHERYHEAIRQWIAERDNFSEH